MHETRLPDETREKRACGDVFLNMTQNLKNGKTSRRSRFLPLRFCSFQPFKAPLKNQNRTGSIFQQELQPNGVYSLPLGLSGMQSRNLAAAAAAAATQV